MVYFRHPFQKKAIFVFDINEFYINIPAMLDVLMCQCVTACEATTKETVSGLCDEYYLFKLQFYLAYMQILLSPKTFSYRICAVGVSVMVQE